MIKNKLLIVFILIAMNSIGQQLSFDDWTSLSIDDFRMLPKYGNVEKSEEHLKADQEFIDSMLKTGRTKEMGSSEMIDKGFEYLYKGDPKTAMYRFNQAYLLNPENNLIYWGYGSIYMYFGKYKLAREQYKEGLQKDPNQHMVLTDLGTTYLGDFYTDGTNDLKNIEEAISIFKRSFDIDPTYESTTYKLSISYLLLKDCENARKFLKITQDLGGNNITNDYLTDFNLSCKQENMDCSRLKTGKYKIEDERTGTTLIERNEEFQFEVNEKYNYNSKLKIKWLDDCTYQLSSLDEDIDPNDEMSSIVITCTITEINDKGYVQVSSSDKSDFKLTALVEYVKD